MLVDPAYLSVIKDPPAPPKERRRSKVERKNRADYGPDQQERPVYEARPGKRPGKKRNRELDRYL